MQADALRTSSEYYHISRNTPVAYQHTEYDVGVIFPHIWLLYEEYVYRNESIEEQLHETTQSFLVAINKHMTSEVPVSDTTKKELNEMFDTILRLQRMLAEQKNTEKLD